MVSEPLLVSGIDNPDILGAVNDAGGICHPGHDMVDPPVEGFTSFRLNRGGQKSVPFARTTINGGMYNRLMTSLCDGE